MCQINSLVDMPLKHIKFFSLGLVLLTMFGCREYDLYQYEPVTLDVLGGKLVAKLEGTYGENYERESTKKADYSYPYSFKFMLSMPYSQGLKKLAIKNIELVGTESQRQFFLPDVASDKVKDPRIRSNPDAEARTVIASIGNITADQLSYETYLVKALVVVYRNETDFHEESISFYMKTDFTQERRSDWFDRGMSP